MSGGWSPGIAAFPLRCVHCGMPHMYGWSCRQSMSRHAQDQIRQMRADVDKLARESGRIQEVEKTDKIIILFDRACDHRIRLRKLAPGERRQNGDLVLKDTGELVALRLPWWMPKGRVRSMLDATYFRVLD